MLFWPQILALRVSTQILEEPSKPLTWILSGLGEDYNCFFTIEEAWQEDEPANKLESEWTHRSGKKGGLVQELDQLRRDVPEFGYELGTVDTRIVHVIDTRLRGQDGYAIERTIASLDFKGLVNALPDAIGKQGIPISLPPWQFTHEQRDGSTVVVVNAVGLKVRDALSNFVKLDGRDRVLWIARTKLEKGAITYVHYPWPGRTVK